MSKFDERKVLKIQGKQGIIWLIEIINVVINV